MNREGAGGTASSGFGCIYKDNLPAADSNENCLNLKKNHPIFSLSFIHSQSTLGVWQTL